MRALGCIVIAIVLGRSSAAGASPPVDLERPAPVQQQHDAEVPPRAPPWVPSEQAVQAQNAEGKLLWTTGAVFMGIGAASAVVAVCLALKVLGSAFIGAEPVRSDGYALDGLMGGFAGGMAIGAPLLIDGLVKQSRARRALQVAPGGLTVHF